MKCEVLQMAIENVNCMTSRMLFIFGLKIILFTTWAI